MVLIKKYKPTSHKIKALIYGDSGSGKTSFGGTAKNVIFASAEAGLLSLGNKGVDFAEIESIKDLRELLTFLKKEDHGFETVVIDSITEINDIIKAEIEKKNGKPMQLQDWGVLSKDIAKILRAFRSLDMNVIMIAQEKIIQDEDKIHKIVPDLNGKSADTIARFMDIVGHAEILTDGSYIINIVPDKGLVTKDRTRLLGNDMVPDFMKWIEALEGMDIGEQEVIEDTENEETQEEEEIISEIKKEEPKKTKSKTQTKSKETEIKEVEEVKEEKIDRFIQVYEEIKMSANEETLNLILDNLKVEIRVNKNLLTKDQMKEIASIKKDMITTFKNKEEKK